MALDRILHRIPAELANDNSIAETLLAYLSELGKIGTSIEYDGRYEIVRNNVTACACLTSDKPTNLT